MKFLPRLRLFALLAGLALTTTAVATGCQGCSQEKAQQQATQADATAQAAKLDSLRPRLEQVAREHPDQADAVADVIGNWPTRPERETYDKAAPLIALYQADHPDDPGTEPVMKSWRIRLDRFGK